MKQEAKAEAARSRIVEAAIVEFGTKGYNEASTNEICLACGLSKGLLFYYFKSKETLFTECASFCMEQFDRFMKCNFIKGNTPMEGIRGCCYARKQFFVENPYYHRIFCDILYSQNNLDRKRYQLFIQKYEHHTYGIIDQILKGVKLNQRIDREESIQIAVNVMETIDMNIWSSEHKAEENGKLLEEQMKKYENFLTILFYGILKDQP